MWVKYVLETQQNYVILCFTFIKTETLKFEHNKRKSLSAILSWVY